MVRYSSRWLCSILAVVISVYIFIIFQNLDALLQVDGLLDSLDNSLTFNIKSNRFLLSNFAPVDIEHVNLDASIISGSIPVDVEGLFIRVGPNPVREHIGQKRYHWFDGHGMIHSLRINQSSVSYSNQYIKTPRYKAEIEKGKSIFLMLGEMQGYVGVMKLLWNMIAGKEKLLDLDVLKTGQANTAVVQYGHKILVCHEASLPFSIVWNKDNSFESVGFDDMNGGLHFPVTAHPKVDPWDGNMYFVSYSPIPGQPSVTYGAIRDDYVLHYNALHLPESPWIHDMMITRSHILVLASSVGFSINGIINDGPFHFERETPFRIGVARKGGEEVSIPFANSSEVFQSDSIQWFEAAGPALVIHAVNAWEADNKILLWVLMASEFEGSLQHNSNSFRMTCLTLDLATGTMQRGILARDYNVEMPRIHPKCLGVPCRYAFASIIDKDGGEGSFSGFVKFDLFSKSVAGVVVYPRGLGGGEMVPIAKKNTATNPTRGGDGSDQLYLASFFFDKEFNGTEWRLYDGETMSSSPVARVRVPRRVPYGFHGEWIEEIDLQAHMDNAKKSK